MGPLQPLPSDAPLVVMGLEQAMTALSLTPSPPGGKGLPSKACPPHSAGTTAEQMLRALRGPALCGHPVVPSTSTAGWEGGQRACSRPRLWSPHATPGQCSSLLRTQGPGAHRGQSWARILLGMFQSQGLPLTPCAAPLGEPWSTSPSGGEGGRGQLTEQPRRGRFTGPGPRPTTPAQGPHESHVGWAGQC